MRDLLKNPAVHVLFLGLIVAAAILLAKGPPVTDASRRVVITGADLFRSQTAENVINVYRIAAGEYSPPKEMLTDQGRQYTNWRGKTKFEIRLPVVRRRSQDCPSRITDLASRIRPCPGVAAGEAGWAGGR